MASRSEIRKERNKLSAAKSRANRKALFDEMARTIGQLRLENAALKVLLKDNAPAVSSFQVVESDCCSHVMEAFIDNHSCGGFYDEPITSEELKGLMEQVP